MENYVLYEELGRGTFSIVYKGRKKGSIEYVAVNCAEKVKRKELQNIVRLTHELSHENIVTFYEWYETTNHIWMIMELCTGQSLSTMLEQDGCFPEEAIQGFGIDIARGLCYLHDMCILYCDLRCSKLILDGCGRVKLSNFSLARINEAEEDADELVSEIEDSEENRRPSPMYMAPEILQGHPHSIPSDLWSFGCVLYELFTGCLPFEAETFTDLVHKVNTQAFLYPLQVIDKVELGPSDKFVNILESLLCKQKESRPVWNALLNHPFWDGRLGQLSMDNIADSIEEDIINARHPCSVAKEEREAIHDQKPFFEKSNLECKKFMLTRPETAPERGHSNLGHGTYKVEQLRPHTTQSIKTQKMNKVEAKDSVALLEHSNKSRKKIQNERQPRVTDERLRSGSTSIAYGKGRHLKTDESIQNVGSDCEVEDLLYHPSDFILTSIVDNPKIKKLVLSKWDAKTMGVTLFSVEQLLEMDFREQEKFFNEILKILQQAHRGTGQAGGQRAKLHCASYLASISREADVANMIVNSDLCIGILHVIKNSPSADLKGRLGLTLGLMAGNATMISETFKMSDVFMVLSETIRDNFKNAKLKQSLLPCLGEFLFYAATQEENDGRTNENWEVPGISFTIIVKCLREGEDSIVQHYAAKIIENIATTDTQHCEKFVTMETAQMLWNLFTHCSGDSQKFTAISALCRLTRHSVALFQHIIDKVGLRTVLNSLFSGVLKVQQAMITILAALVCKGAHTRRLVEDKEFVLRIMHFLESSSVVIRGKAFVAIAAMARENPPVSREHNHVSGAHSREHRVPSRENQIVSRENHVALLHCCQSKLVVYIERDTKRQTPGKVDPSDSAKYLRDSLTLCVQNVCRCVPAVVTNLLAALRAVSGRNHPSAAQSKELKSCIPLMSIVLHLVTSNVFRDRVVDASFVEHVGQLMSHVTSTNSGVTAVSSKQQVPSECLENIVLSTLEAIAQHPTLMLRHREVFVDYVMPSLAALSFSEEGDVRMFCLKMFSDVAALFLDGQTLVEDHGKECASKLSELISSRFLPRYDSILLDQDPLPSYGLKLLLAFLEHSPTFSEVVIGKGTVTILGEILERHNCDLSGSTVQTIVSLLDCLVSSCTDDLSPLYEQGLIDHVTTLFVNAADLVHREESERNYSDIILPLLDTVHGIMKYSSKVVRDAFQAERGSESREKAEQVLLQGKPFAELARVLVPFLCHSDLDIQEWALRCLYQVVELFGGSDDEAMSNDH